MDASSDELAARLSRLEEALGAVVAAVDEALPHLPVLAGLNAQSHLREARELIGVPEPELDATD